jgi:hypothetical protein
MPRSLGRPPQKTVAIIDVPNMFYQGKLGMATPWHKS